MALNIAVIGGWNIPVSVMKPLLLDLETQCRCPVQMLDYPGYELMQYTGLTDKNGKEIYEGDIVQYNQNSSYDNMDFIAKWSDDKLGFIFQSNSGEQLVNQTPHLNRFKHLEVVGNIFEHSELLK